MKSYRRNIEYGWEWFEKLACWEWFVSNYTFDNLNLFVKNDLFQIILLIISTCFKDNQNEFLKESNKDVLKIQDYQKNSRLSGSFCWLCFEIVDYFDCSVDYSSICRLF